MHTCQYANPGTNPGPWYHKCIHTNKGGMDAMQCSADEKHAYIYIVNCEVVGTSYSNIRLRSGQPGKQAKRQVDR